MSGLMLSTTFEQYFNPLRIGSAARDTLQEFIDIDVTADDLAQILNRNQVYQDLFRKTIFRKKGREQTEEERKDEKLSTNHRLVSLLGMIRTRNLLLALRTYEIGHGKFPLDEDGTVNIQVSLAIRHANDFEDFFQRNKLEYSEMAFAVGFYFDCLKAFLPQGNAKMETYFANTWRKSKQTALIAFLLAYKVEGCSPKFAIASGAMSQVGRIYMSRIFGPNNESDSSPIYMELEPKMAAADKLDHLARYITEQEIYGVTQEEFGAFSLRCYDIFASLEPVIRFYREPYCLKNSDPMMYKMALIVNLAESMATYNRAPSSETDEIFKVWDFHSLHDLNISKKILIETMETLAKLS